MPRLKKGRIGSRNESCPVPTIAAPRKNCRRESRLGGEDFATVDSVTSGRGQPGEDCRSLTCYFRFPGTPVPVAMQPGDSIGLRLPVRPLLIVARKPDPVRMRLAVGGT